MAYSLFLISIGFILRSGDQHCMIVQGEDAFQNHIYFVEHLLTHPLHHSSYSPHFTFGFSCFEIFRVPFLSSHFDDHKNLSSTSKFSTYFLI